MSTDIELLIKARDEEWRWALVGPPGTYISDNLCKTPSDARGWMEAIRELHWEDEQYFHKKAERARLKRREIKSELREVAIEWHRAISADCDPRFSKGIEAILRAALPKELKGEKPL